MALRSNISGNNNTASGYNSLGSNTLEVEILLLDITLYLAILLVRIIPIWCSSTEQTSTGNRNTAIGVAAIDQNTTGVIMLS
jgi:hypothetical protein